MLNDFFNVDVKRNDEVQSTVVSNGAADAQKKAEVAPVGEEAKPFNLDSFIDDYLAAERAKEEALLNDKEALKNDASLRRKLSTIMVAKSVWDKYPWQVDIDEFLNMCKSEEIRRKIVQWRYALDNGTGTDEVKKITKEKLPVYTPNSCCYINGERNNTSGRGYFAFSADFDHLPFDVVAWYEQNLKGKEKELNIRMVSLSASLNLHIDAVRQDNETILQAQQRMAHQLGLGAYVDTQCQDLQHPFFMPYIDDILYVDKDLYYFDTLAAKEECIAHFAEIDKNAKDARTDKALAAAAAEASATALAQLHSTGNNQQGKARSTTTNTQLSTPNSTQQGEARSTTTNAEKPGKIVYRCDTDIDKIPVVEGLTEYKGVDIRELINEDIRRLLILAGNSDGIVYEGIRNKTYYLLATDLRFVVREMIQNTDKKIAPTMVDIMPDWELSYDERARAVVNAIDSENPIYDGFKRLLDSLIDEDDEPAVPFPLQPVRPNYPFPEPIKSLVRRLSFNDEYVDAAVMASVAVLGTEADVKFDYWYDGAEQSFAFQVHTIGNPASGKSLIYDAAKLAAHPLFDNDEQADAEEAAYYAQLEERQWTGLSNGEKPQKPVTPKRMVGTKISEGEILRIMKNAGGKRVLQSTSELGEIVANGRKEYGPPTQVYNKSFDSDTISSSFADKKYFCGTTKSTLNVVTCGQPQYLDYFIQNTGNGLASRQYYSLLPESGTGVKKIDKYTEAEKITVKEWANALFVREPLYISCPWADEAAEQWHDKVTELKNETGSKTIEYFINRDAVMLTRMMYMFSLLYGVAQYASMPQEVVKIKEDNLGLTPEERRKAAVEWGLYFGDKLLNTQYELFSSTLEVARDLKPMPVELANVYAALPDEFTRKDMQAVCTPTQKQNLSRQLKHWLTDGWIEKVKHGEYRKLRAKAS